MINEASHKLNSNLEKSEIINTVKNQIIERCHATEVGFISCENQEPGDLIAVDGSTSFFTAQLNKPELAILYEEIRKRTTSMFYGDFRAIHHSFPFQSVMIIP